MCENSHYSQIYQNCMSYFQDRASLLEDGAMTKPKSNFQCCYYCGRKVSKIARQYTTVHNDKEEKIFNKLPVNDRARY